MIYELDILNNIDDCLRDIFHFLGVHDAIKINISERYNIHGELQNPLLRWSHRTLLYHDYIQAITKRLPTWLIDPLRGVMYALRKRDEVKPVLDAVVREELQAYFRDDILKTQALIERDLSMWLTHE